MKGNKEKMKDLIIVGASGFGRELLSLIQWINQREATWNVRGFIDDNLHALDGFDLEQRILGTIQDWQPSGDELYALAIAAPRTKEKVVSILRGRGASFATIIAPGTTFGPRTTLGEGVVAFGDVGVSVDVKIGNYVFFNAMVGIGHDTVIGDYSTIGPKACISGRTVIGKCVNIGAMASTYPGIKVGDYATIGMNSAAIRNVKPGVTVIGVPAKII